MFLPDVATSTMFSRGIVVKTVPPPLTLVSSVKHEIWSVDRSVAISNADAITDYLKRFAYAEPRLGLFVFGAFASIGLVLVILGVYSLIAYTVARQTREIGIRMAVGASRADVLRMTVGMGIRWIGGGVGRRAAGEHRRNAGAGQPVVGSQSDRSPHADDGHRGDRHRRFHGQLPAGAARDARRSADRVARRVTLVEGHYKWLQDLLRLGANADR